MRLSTSTLMASISLILAGATLSGCAGTATPIDLTTRTEMHCGRLASVTVLDDVVSIGAGERPTPGYAVELTSQTRKKDHIKLNYRVSTPTPGAMLPQMMTSPCQRIELPDDWQRLTVTDEDSGQDWIFERS